MPPADFADDHGAAEPLVLAAVTAYARDPCADTARALMAVLPGSRWLIPVVPAPEGALPQEHHGDEDDHEHDDDEHGPAMVTTILGSGQGERGFPVFGSLAALTRWDPQARPVPVRMAAAALAAAQERCDALLLDWGSEHQVALPGSMLWALAEERDWLPAYLDPVIGAVLEEFAAGEPAVRRIEPADGRPPGTAALDVIVHVEPGAPHDLVVAAVERLGARLGGSADTRARIDAVRFVLRTQTGEPSTQASRTP